MLRRSLTVLSSLCLIVGGVQGGRGAWIYVKAELAQVLLHRAWAQVKGGEEQARPWPWADAWPVARLRMPDRGVDHIVLAGASGRNLAFAPGHLHGTAAPGEDGACVVAGHRDTHFGVLEEVEPGEIIVLERPDGARTTYRVSAKEIVDEHDTSILEDVGRSTLVLVTCWPFNTPVPGGPLRYVVFAEEDVPATTGSARGGGGGSSLLRMQAFVGATDPRPASPAAHCGVGSTFPQVRGN